MKTSGKKFRAAVATVDRARAYTLTRNYMAAEPDCAYIPAAWTGEHNALVTA